MAQAISSKPVKRMAVLISGRGSNLRALIEASDAPRYPARIVLVVADRLATGCAFSRARGIETFEIIGKSSTEFESILEYRLKACAIDIVCLAGFMRILSADFIGRWRARIVNIHPSLLPELPGLRTHRRALEQGHRVHGCTVHEVTERVDCGKILRQGWLKVASGETEQSLAQRVLALEHELYPCALADVARALP